MVLTDIFGERIRYKNASLVSFSEGTTLLKAKEMFEAENLTLDTFKVVVLFVGHADAPYDNKLFKKRYQDLIQSVGKVNMTFKIVYVSLLPLKWDTTMYALFKNRNAALKRMCGKDADRQEKEFFCDALAKMRIQGRIQPEFISNGRLNMNGIKFFTRVLGHKLAAIQSLWPPKLDIQARSFWEENIQDY